MKKLFFTFLILALFLSILNTTFASVVLGNTINGASGKVEILNNSKNDAAGDFSLSVSLDFDPDSTEGTQFKLPQGSDDQIIVKLLGSTGKSLVSSKVISVANLKPTSSPIFSAVYPKEDFLKAFPDPSSPENNAFVQIEDFTSKKIYYKSNIFQVFQYTKQSNTKNKTVGNAKYYFTWQDVAGGYKTEREVIGKDACESERTSGQYKITTPCSTTSNKASIDAFNKTAGAYPFTWQMDNFATKEIRKGGGDTVVLCNLDRSGKIIDLTPTQLKSWTNTKNCSDTKNTVEPYYFNWEDTTTKNKTEVAFTSKKDCEAEQVNKKYTNATSCYAPSQQSSINAYNNATVVNPDKQSATFDNEYRLLSPIGNLTSIGGASENKIGDYLNIILMIAIGLCGALAVIMIVVRGVQYMGDESVFGKTEAKHHIMQAVLGLILALGAYAILNTINPNLVGGSLTFNSVDIVISADDTSTGSSTSLCISTTNPPNPDSAKGSKLTLNPTMTNEYLPAIKKLTSISTGKRLLMTAQTHTEGFYPGSKSYRTNNPGNIGNTDDGKTKTFKTLEEGIAAQSTKVVSGQGSYQIGGKSKCALGDETYDGSLYQYLRIYSTGARKSNTYVDSIIGYFAQNGKTITARTKMTEIYNMK
jgi:hypothetical protein